MDIQQVAILIPDLQERCDTWKYKKDVQAEYDKILAATGCSPPEVMEYVVTNDPILWAYVYLNWEPRDYQVDILDQGRRSKKTVLRLGRRLGKSECMCILILWHAWTKANKGANEDQYDILILAPFEEQVDLIFKRLHQLIDAAPMLQQSVTRDVYHNITINGANIKGLTAASKAGTGAANTRGQRADLIIMDEIDYMGSSEITNILNIRNEAPDRIKVLVASTPCGKREEFYKWCMGASISYRPDQRDIDNYEFTGYHINKQKGNGWVEIYAPSVVNKELLKHNPDTEQTYLEDIKEELSEMRFDQEVMAMFGEEAFGLYQKKHVDWAVEEGARYKHRYYDELSLEEQREVKKVIRYGPVLLGVDWDKVGADTNMVCLTLDKLHENADGEKEPIFKVLFRVEIPRGDFTYVNAVNKIIELNDEFNFDWVVIDRGYGEVQLELLRKYGMNNPLSGLHEKTIGYQFSERLPVRDPYTNTIDNKPLKPFMVNNSIMVFERHKIMLHPKDKKLITQFENYRIKSISSTGLPTYDDKDEHMVDALNLCLLVFEQKYGDLFKTIMKTRILALDPMSFHDEAAVKSRLKDQSHKKLNQITLGGVPAVIRPNNRTGRTNESTERFNRRKNLVPNRRSF